MTSPATFTSPTPDAQRTKHWQRWAKDVTWTVADGTLTFTAPGKHPIGSWSAPIGDGPGQVARCVHVSGRFTLPNGNTGLLDHYVFVDSTGTQVGTAVRRSREGLLPAAAWWPLTEFRAFLSANGIPFTAQVLASSRDLTAQYPGLVDQCPTLSGRKRLFGLLPA